MEAIVEYVASLLPFAGLTALSVSIVIFGTGAVPSRPKTPRLPRRNRR